MDDEKTDTEGVAETPTYELELTGGGITVKREVEEDVALRILAAVMGGGGAVATLRPRAGAGPGAAVRGTGRSMALREYLDEVEASRKPDKILAIASYLEIEREVETFQPADIKKEFKNASEPVPGNFGRDFRWAAQAGWIAPAEDEPGAYYVTDKGRKAVEAKFSADVRRATPQGKGRRRRTRRRGGDE